MRYLVTILLLFLTLTLQATKVYVSPTGDDSRSKAVAGNIATPWATWSKLNGNLVAGDTAYIRGGSYTETEKGATYSYFVLWNNMDGTVSDSICIFNYPGEKPVLHLGSKVMTQTSNYGIWMTNSEYVYIKGLRVTYMHSNANTIAMVGMLFDSNNRVRIENVEIDHIDGYGFQIRNSSNMIFKNCDAHHLDDFYVNAGHLYAHEDANGFGITGAINTSTNITFSGCRTWLAGDDGWDFYNSAGIISIDSCWAFWNGYGEGFVPFGNGCGFKVGPNATNMSTTHLRTITNSMSIGNRYIGFNQNSSTYSSIGWYYNNLAYRNGRYGFQFGWPMLAYPRNIFKNNIAYSNPINKDINNLSEVDHNSWNIYPDAAITDFISLDTSQLDAPRKSNGTLPDIIFGHLSGTSKYINAGVDVGYGNDVGPFQYSVPSPVAIPVLITSEVKDIGLTTATGGGNIIESGGANVTARGVCWNTSANPTTANSKTSDGSGTGYFSSSITGLTQSTTYFVRAYATNSVGTAYGNEVTFDTGPPTFPVVTTEAVTRTSDTSATGTGNVTSEGSGGGVVSSRGVCWASTSEPTKADNYTTASTGGLGTYTVAITGIVTPGIYYVRAWATNQTMTNYGESVVLNMTKGPLLRGAGNVLMRDANGNLIRVQ